MDNFNQIYNEILNNENEKNDNKENKSFGSFKDSIIDYMKCHFKSLVDQNDYMMKYKLMQLKADGREMDFSANIIDQFYNIECLDELRFKFKVTDLLVNKSDVYYIVDKSLINNINKNSGIVLDDYIIFKNDEIKFKKGFIKNRKNFMDNAKNMNLQFGMQPKEETMNDVLLQYMGYFRR